MDALISVVIPVFMVDRYLDRCLESVVTQTHQNLEIILVDDGSTDNCPQMCDEWACRDSRIRVFHKKNAGLGMARNTGIENAKGEYICFVDSDDYIAPDILKLALELTERTSSEITFYGLSTVDANGVVTGNQIPISPKTCYEGDEVCHIFLPDLIHSAAKEATIHNISLSVCSCIFSMDLLRRTGWRFQSERIIISEDSYALLELFRDVQRVAVLSRTGYYYCNNSKSLTRSYRPDRYEKISQFYLQAVRLQQKLKYSETVKERLGRLFLAFVVGAMKQMVATEEPSEVQYRNIKRIVIDPLLQDVLRDLDISCYPWKIWLLFIMIRNRYSRLVYFTVRLQVLMNREV